LIDVKNDEESRKVIE